MCAVGPKVKLIIVEDEIILAKDIRQRLIDHNYDVVGIASSADKTLRLLEENLDVDILLIDIVIKGDVDGIELAKVVKRKYNVPFIFLTSHADDSFISRAKKIKPHAYILKPFNDRQVKVAIELALLNFSRQTDDRGFFDSEIEDPDQSAVLQIKDSLFLKKDHHFERVQLENILYLEAENNYCSVHTKSDRFLYSLVLKKIESQLPSNQFLRIHRSYVVNINSVTGFGGNMLYIGDKRIPVSRTYKDKVFQLFKTI